MVLEMKSNLKVKGFYVVMNYFFLCQEKYFLKMYSISQLLWKKNQKKWLILFFKIFVRYYAVKIHQKLSFVDRISYATFFDSFF